MQTALIKTRAQLGIDAPAVRVEVHISSGLPKFNIVGLAETIVKESKERVRSAIITSNFEFPMRRITVNLAPADLPKEGGRYDLPIALGILSASKQIQSEQLSDYEFAGELALTGELHPINGCISFLVQSQKYVKNVIVPVGNNDDAIICGGNSILLACSLLDVCAHLNSAKTLSKTNFSQQQDNTESADDFCDIYGQHSAKRALEIAAAGNHNILLIGPPGAGKTMLVSRLPSILPNLNVAESLEVAAIYNAANNQDNFKSARTRPFRSPHHTSSAVALVGGGAKATPGEISLAHNGILFLDELPEFAKKVLEVLREPLEAKKITIARANKSVSYPANFILVAAMNPCPCGYLGDKNNECVCNIGQVKRYSNKLSGPLLDRIDIQIEVPALSAKALADYKSSNNETSQAIKQRVLSAQAFAYTRQKITNNNLSVKQLEQYCHLNKECKQYILEAIEQLNLTTRSYHRILKLARTIADLDKCDLIATQHLSEAIQLRNYDRKKTT